MKIRLAKTAGFCMGVRRAVDLVLDIQRDSPPLPIVTYGPLIHNPQTLQLLESRGIKQVDFLEQIQGGTVFIRAHGISPLERHLLEQKALRIIDATCPRVARVQAIIRKHARVGDFCVIVGDKDHPEVRGLMGFASAGGLAVPTPEYSSQIEMIPEDRGICLVAQTTQEDQTFQVVIEILRKRLTRLHVYNTICDSTRKRQLEVSQLAKNVDMIVIVGGKGSGNTRRLVKVAQAQGMDTLHVETDEEIVPSLLFGAETVGVTAGASTPNWQILSVIEKIKQIGMSRKSGPLAVLRRVADTVVMTYLWAALGGGGLTAACIVLQGQQTTLLPLLVTMLFVFSMHLLNRIQDISGAVRFNTPQIAAFYARHRRLLSALVALSSIGSLFLSAWMGIYTCLLLLFMLVTGGLYTAPLISASRFPSAKLRSLKDLPGSKTPLVAAGWAMSAAVLPVIGTESSLLLPGLIVGFVFAAGMVFWRTALSDLMDIQGDRIVGRETIPILLGAQNTSRLLLGLLLFLTILPAASAALGWVARAGFLLTINTSIFAVIFLIYKRRHPFDRLSFEAMLDSNFILAGGLSFLYDNW